MIGYMLTPGVLAALALADAMHRPRHKGLFERTRAAAESAWVASEPKGRAFAAAPLAAQTFSDESRGRPSAVPRGAATGNASATASFTLVFDRGGVRLQ